MAANETRHVSSEKSTDNLADEDSKDKEESEKLIRDKNVQLTETDQMEHVESQLIDNDITVQCHSAVQQHTVRPKSFRRFLYIRTINREIILLRIMLFFFFGSGAAIISYFAVFLNQRGLSITKISIMQIISPILQFFLPIGTGIASDKLGRLKYVLLGTMILLTLTINILLFLPPIANTSCASVSELACNFSAIPYNETLDLDLLNCSIPCRLGNSSTDCPFTDEASLSLNNTIQTSISWSTIIKETNCTLDAINSTNCSQFYIPGCNVSCLKINITKKEECQQISETPYTVLYCFLSITTFALLSSCYSLIDVYVIAVSSEHDSYFGYERSATAAACTLFYIITGCIFSFKRSSSNEYAKAFYVFDVAIVISMVALMKLKIQRENKAKHMWKAALYLAKNIDMLALMLATTLLGTGFCFAMTFTALHLHTLNSPGVVYGLNHAMRNVVAFPLLIKSKILLDKIGTKNMPFIAFATYVIFFVSFSFIQNPWWSVFLFAAGAIFYELLWVALIIRANELTPNHIIATVITLLSGLHYDAGDAISGAVGGLTMANYGGTIAFRLMAVFAGISGLLYGIYLLLTRKASNIRTTGNAELQCRGNNSNKYDGNLEQDVAC